MTSPRLCSKRWPAALGLLLLVGGCEELEPFTPSVAFQEFDLEEISFERVQTDFVFSVDNPNPIDIELASFSYAFGFADVELLSGDAEDGFELEAVGSSELVLPVGMDWVDAWDAVQATRGEDEIAFGLDGHFGFDTPLGEARLPYHEAGSFPALRTPRFSLLDLRADKVNLLDQTAEIEVDFGVDNDHGSTLIFEAFSYDLSLGGRKVADGTLQSLGSVEGATVQTFTLPAEIDLVGVGTSVVNALLGQGNLRVGLDADMDVTTPFGVLPLHIDETGELSVQ